MFSTVAWLKSCFKYGHIGYRDSSNVGADNSNEVGLINNSYMLGN